MAVVLEPGSTLAGYRVERLLGRGGMGAVYLAEHVRLGRSVALKVLPLDLAEKEDFRERFIRESRLAASIEHPNVIPVYDADERDGVLFLAMRYVRGLDLKQLLEQEERLPPERALEVVEAIAAGLDAAHGRGLVHRDVKPANVLIEQPGGHVYVSDFGLAKVVDASGLTRKGMFLGTPDYCAPEQIEGKEVDARSDVYSLGCVLLECLTGERPFPKDSDVAVIYAHLQDPVPAVTTRRPELPASLDGVVATAMAKYPLVRYSSCGALAQALREALAPAAASAIDVGEQPSEPTRAAQTRPAPAPTVTAPGRAPFSPPAPPPRGRRSRGPIALAAAALLALGVAAAAAVLLLGGDDDPNSSGTTTTSPSVPVIGDEFARAVDDIVGPIVPHQRAVTDRVGSLELDNRSLAGLEAVTEELENAVVRGQGAATVLAARNAREEAVADELRAALSEHERYARAVSRLARTAAPGQPQLRGVVADAARVSVAYGLVSEQVPDLTAVPISEESHQSLLSLRPPPAPPPPPPAPTRRAIPLAQLLQGPAPDDPIGQGRCFGPYRSGAYLQIAGIRYSTNFIQCGDYAPARGDPQRANGDYTFRTPQLRAGARLVRVTALAGVDEASSSSQGGATVSWTVAYDGRDVCTASATWSGRPSQARQIDCRLPANATDVSRLVIRQRVSLGSNGQFWAGLANPVLTVAE